MDSHINALGGHTADPQIMSFLLSALSLSCCWNAAETQLLFITISLCKTNFLVPHLA